jgi:methylmalonyl-CoA mutase
MDDLPLAAEFPPATRERWLALVEGVLKGAEFEKKLVSRTYDGIRIEPLYNKADTDPVVGPRGPWRGAPRVAHPDPAAANELALPDLAGGADALTVVLDGAPSARGFGLSARGVDDLDRALDGVMLDGIRVRLEAGIRGREAADWLLEVAQRRGHALADLDLDLGLDPIGAMAAQGRLSAPWETVAARCAERLTDLAGRGFTGAAFSADGRPYNEAGSGEAQELAAVLATGVAYLRALEGGGHDLATARDALAFVLVADADEFLTVAKMRALRILWARVEAACGLTAKPMRLHAETAWRTATRRDPWVNLLRATTATFSAGIGGADSVTVLPFTAALGLPDAFARGLARNTQTILLEESNLWRSADAAAGAGGFEALTDALCDTAWEAFQELEREGGIVASLARGALQGRIAAARAERERNVSRRKDPITGTSEFPDLRETPVSVLMPAPRRRELAQPGERACEPLPSRRLAEPFEALRDRSDYIVEQTGSRRKVFLANLGPPSSFTARAGFAKNLFEAGGMEAVGNEGFASMDDLREAYRASGAKLACLCGSDEIYARHAAAAAQALRAANCTRIYLAGRPGELAEALRQAGVGEYVFAGCDAVQVLSEALDGAAGLP